MTWNIVWRRARCDVRADERESGVARLRRRRRGVSQRRRSTRVRASQRLDRLSLPRDVRLEASRRGVERRDARARGGEVERGRRARRAVVAVVVVVVRRGRRPSSSSSSSFDATASRGAPRVCARARPSTPTATRARSSRTARTPRVGPEAAGYGRRATRGANVGVELGVKGVEDGDRKRGVGGEMRRAKSLRIGVHHANAVVWEPVTARRDG